MSANDLGPWIISGVALVQVWIIAAVKRFRRAKLDFFESQNLEIGFSQFGPTVAVIGTLRTHHKDFFVRAMSLRVTRLRDNMTRTFDWQTFRSLSFVVGESPEIELAGSFLLMTDYPEKLSMVFKDEAFIAEVKGKAESMVPKWFAFKQDRGLVASSPPEEVEAAFHEFIKNGGGLDAYNVLDRSFYWTAGEYALQINVIRDDGKSLILREYRFKLHDEDEARLRTNVHQIQRFLAGLPIIWGSAYPKYEVKGGTSAKALPAKM